MNDVVGSAVVLLGGLDVRTTTHNLFEKTSMDTTDQVFQAGIRIRTKVKASLGDEPQ